MAILLIALFALSFDAAAQQRQSPQRRTQQTTRAAANPHAYRISPDAQEMINKACPRVIADARAITDFELRVFCPISEIDTGMADLGPWKKFVNGLVRLFQQFRKLIYLAGVFLLLWIVIEGAYRGEGQWMKLAMMIIGLILLAMAEVFVNLATGKVEIESIKSGDLFVDCRRPNEALFQCRGESKGAQSVDERFIFRFQRAEAASGKSAPTGGTRGLW